MLPNDPNILFSYINTKLRDEYLSFEELCRSNMYDATAVLKKLAAAGYVYDAESNKFVIDHKS